MNAAPPPLATDLDTIAADWLARQRSGTMTPAEECELQLWLARDVLHREAFATANAVWRQVDAIRSNPRILALREHDSNVRRRRGQRTAWIAACLALAVGLWAFGPNLAALHDFGTREASQEFRTNVGQTATITLADGSVVTLDTDTVVRTRSARRQRLLELAKGQAYFRVAKDASRPFIVSAGGRTVTALGTAFDVRVDPARFQVTLVEGRVRVEAPAGGRTVHAQTAELTAGSRLVAVDDRTWSVSEVNTARATSWLNGRLTYDNEPLGVMAADMNRYSNKKIVIGDSELARTALSGTYKAGDVDGFVRALEAYGIARVLARGPDSVELVVAEKNQ